MPREVREAEAGEHLAEAADEEFEIAVDFLEADRDVVRCGISLHKFFPAGFLARDNGRGKQNSPARPLRASRFIIIASALRGIIRVPPVK